MAQAAKTVFVAFLAGGLTYFLAGTSSSSGIVRDIFGNISAPELRIVLSGFVGLVAAALHAINA